MSINSSRRKMGKTVPTEETFITLGKMYGNEGNLGYCYMQWELAKHFHQGNEKSDCILERSLLYELKEKEIRNREIRLEDIVTVQMTENNLRQRLGMKSREWHLNDI